MYGATRKMQDQETNIFSDVSHPNNEVSPEEDFPLLGSSSHQIAEEHSRNTHHISLFPEEIVNSPLATIFLILNVMIGAGFLVQPYVFKQCGILTASILYAYFGYACFEGSALLVYLAKHYQVFNFADLVFSCFGITGAMALDLSIVFIMGGSVLSYTMLLGSLSSTILAQYVSANAWYTSDIFLTSLWVLLVIFPMCTARQLGDLAIIAYYSIGVVFATALLIIIGGPIMYEDSITDDASNKIHWVTSGTGTLSAMGSILFAMAYLPAVLPAYESAQTQTKRNFTHYLLICAVIGISLYYSLGLIGYLTFRENVEVDILENFSGVWSSFFQIAICFHLAFIVPGYFVIIRLSLSNLWVCSNLLLQGQECTMTEIRQKRDRFADDDVYFFLSTSCLLVAIYVITMSIQATLGSDSSAVSFVIALAGGVAGSFEIFVIPGLCGVKSLSHANFYQHKNNYVLSVSSSTSIDNYGTAFDSKENLMVDDKVWQHKTETKRLYYLGWSYVMTVTGVVVAILVTIGTIIS